MRALIIPRGASDPGPLNEVLAPFCTVEIAHNSDDALFRFTHGLESGSPYAIVFFLGIAGMNGVHTALHIRSVESSRNEYPASTLCLVSDGTLLKETLTSRFRHGINVFHVDQPLNKADILTAIGYTAHIWGGSPFK